VLGFAPLAALMAAAVFHVRDGKVRPLITYWDRERALGDLGLFPDGDLHRNV
jgi:hypothetical protein